ncbi:hypothetical protein B296_00039844 [Ensete ventricosum]|uniref:HTH myb-type domain-containing protein n=1 Tax=Ensete ventricosum TaxID=4639 RepID=A0A426ZS90_ENSVE|nr:hypothetical protein B296_00039844 [Ensete ventricosum]
MLRKQSETDEHKIKQEESERDDKYGCEKTMANDTFSAPSTPQLEQGGRFPTNGEFQEITHRSIAKELPQPRKHGSSVSKSVGNTCDNSVSFSNNKNVLPSKIEAEEEVNSVDDSKTDECSAVKEGFLPSHYHSVDDLQKTRLTHSDGARNNRKKMKVDWTPELHRQFVQAVEQLGIDQAIPSKIVKLMKVEGLTRHSVASHLQVEEAIDRFIKDVTSKPWLPPLPLGLKSPSAEMVLAELHRQGICTPLY